MASYIVLKPTQNGEERIKITVELGYDKKTGERIRETKTVRMKSMSERAIKKAITEFEIEVANRELDKSKLVETITFGQFVDQWMDLYVRTELSISTRDSYKVSLNNGIIENLGNEKLIEITTFHLVELLKKLKDRCGSMALNQHTVLKSIFSKAVEWNILENNPMNGVGIPKVEKKKKYIDFYDENELKILLAVLENENPKHKIQIKLAALVGLRLSEVAALRVESLNFKNNTINIDKSLKYDIEEKVLKLVPTKNKKSRIVSVPMKFMNEIKLFVDEVSEYKKSLGNSLRPMKDENDKPIEFIFINTVGYPTRPSSIDAAWKKVISKYNLKKIKFHELRHSYASFLISRNVNFKIIQEQLGHSDIRMTINTYSHLTAKNKSEASDHFNELI
ncbi:tyrosine-type recombinase/integrase [Lysinibacillus sphaericus]|uniref:tyrosine-type recombinase/integrase n=1 Tax=Lysinibacillus sphaericus TaxID=1421 RepID=UPI003D7F5E4F